MPPRAYAQEFGLYAPNGARKYLNQAERQRVLAAIATLKPDDALFCRTLAWTGARVSEVLALTASSFQVEACLVSIRTLKRRRLVIREVPIAPDLMNELDRHFELSARRQGRLLADRRLWPWHRVTAWRKIKCVMRRADLSGLKASPRGLRHAFGVATLQAGVPPNIRQKWLGHARPETTNIYSAVCGPEEFAFAQQFWRETTESAY
ncbi:MAG: site-specific integrase [Alphaproteobacteria bacterium]